jgi:transposase-like protein
MAMARQSERSEKEQYWRGVIRRCERSKQTVRAFCGEHGLSEQSFYWWKRTIAERDQRADGPAFVPLRVSSSTAAPALEVVAGPGRVIRVPTDFDADTLRRLLAVLEEGPSC